MITAEDTMTSARSVFQIKTALSLMSATPEGQSQEDRAHAARMALLAGGAGLGGGAYLMHRYDVNHAPDLMSSRIQDLRQHIADTTAASQEAINELGKLREAIPGQ
jgi:hypothetical protein